MIKQKELIRIDDKYEVDFGKEAPQAQDLEIAVLSALMLNRKAIEEVVDFLRPEMFYNQNNRIIASAIFSLYRNSEPIDILTITNKLKVKGELDTIGGAIELTRIASKVASTAHIEYHARIICQQHIKREMIMMSTGLIKSSYDSNSDAFEILESGQKIIDDVIKTIEVGNFDTVEDLFLQSEARNLIIREKAGVSGVPSGFVDLDKVTGGWQQSDLIILAARPGMGKTSLMLNMARNSAVMFNKPVALFSLEMSSQQLFYRLQSAESQIPLEKFMRIGLNDDEMHHNRMKCSKLIDAPIFIDDTSGISIFELKIKLRKLKRDHNIQLAIVDYIQLMTVGKGADVNSREQEISYISRNLKNIAKELDIPIIALSQLSRAVEKREDRIPILSDLRESGSIEQDADMVMFIYRPEYYGILEDEDNNSTVGKAKLIIAKHRNGATHDGVLLGFDGKLTKFTDVSIFDEPLQANTDFDNEF